MEVQTGRGNGRAGVAGDLRDHLDTIALGGSQVRRGPMIKRWELGLARWGSKRSGGLPMAMADARCGGRGRGRGNGREGSGDSGKTAGLFPHRCQYAE